MARLHRLNAIVNPSTTLASKKLHPARGYLLIAAATFFWGLSAAFGRAVFTGKLFAGAQALRPIDPVILAQSRTTISMLVLVPILLLTRRSLRVRAAHLAQ